MNASSVIQNGPAFFDRTSSARSPRVRGASPGSVMAALRHVEAEHLGRRVDVEDVVEHGLVRRAAADLFGGGGEREAVQAVHGQTRKGSMQRVGLVRTCGHPGMCV